MKRVLSFVLSLFRSCGVASAAQYKAVLGADIDSGHVLYQEKANAELDDAKYEALLGEVNNSLRKAIEPFEQSYELAAGDRELQVAIAEYLKNIYFRFRMESDEYMAAYEKYNTIYKESTE